MNMNSIARKGKLAFRITLYMSLILLLVFAIMVTSMLSYTKKELVAREQEKLEMLAQQNATIAADFMETTLSRQKILMNAIVACLEEVPEENRVPYLKQILTNAQKENKNTISLFFIAEPNLLLPDTADGMSIFASEKATVVSKTQSDNIVGESIR